jgi:hypothetical protein
MNLENALKAEIQFWEDMSGRQAGNVAPNTLERIQMAKLLAEQKLRLYSTECELQAH